MLEPRVLNLNDVVENIEKLLRRVIGADVELSIELDRGLKPVRVDPGQMEQVLMNLAVNARDAMPAGGRLAVRTHLSSFAEPHQLYGSALEKGEYVLLTVTDTGCGMPPEVVARIFEPFFTTKGPGKGTGLGLSTVYGIIETRAAPVFVHSKLSPAPRFVYFPRVDTPVLARYHQQRNHTPFR